MKQLIVATHNEGKLREIRALLAREPVEVLGLADIGWQQEIEETGSTFKENALIKARAIFEATGQAVLADDSGLEVKAMGGGPGVYSARYMGEDVSYDIKNQAILSLLKRVTEKERAADYRCVIAFVRPGRGGRALARTAEGRVDGRIAYEAAGDGGFGYDPIFFLPDRGCTMAQLPEEEKNLISHRGLALQAILPQIEKWIRLSGREG